MKPYTISSVMHRCILVGSTSCLENMSLNVNYVSLDFLS